MKKVYKRVKNRLIYFGALLLYSLAGIIPRKVGLPLFSFIGHIAFAFPHIEKKRTLTHLRMIYNSKWDEKTIKKIARNVFCNIGKNIFDAIKLAKMKRSDFEKIVTYDDMGEIKKALSLGRGLVAITGHIGCYEMLPGFFARMGIPNISLGKKSYDQKIENLIRKFRSGHAYKNDIEYMDRDQNLRRIYKRLSEGAAFGVLIDQDTKVDGVYAPFMGKLAHTPSGPVQIAIKKKIPVVVITTARMANDNHHVYVSPVYYTDSYNSSKEAVVQLTTILNEQLCETIKKHPDQWVWMHRRWKHRPPEEKHNKNFEHKAVR